MGSIEEAPLTAPSVTIPIIDFSRWTQARDPKERQAIAHDLISACQSVGFVYIINHGIPQHLLDQAFATAKDLFDLPLSDKMLAPHPPGPEVHRGYSKPGLEKVSQYSGGDAAEGERLRQVVDVKESYEIGSEENTSQPNVWLPEATLPSFKDFTTSFYWTCNTVAQEILHCIATGLNIPDPANFFSKYCTGHHNQLRLLHYPPIPASDLETGKAARISSHSDWGIITLLFQDDCGGLEVEHPHQPGTYIPATPIEGACIMNIGDLLMRWSNDVLKSTLHRVTLPKVESSYHDAGRGRMTKARYSIPYFVSAEPESLIACLSVCTSETRSAKYAPVKQKDYGAQRAKVQYRKEEDN